MYVRELRGTSADAQKCLLNVPQCVWHSHTRTHGSMETYARQTMVADCAAYGLKEKLRRQFLAIISPIFARVGWVDKFQIQHEQCVATTHIPFSTLYTLCVHHECAMLYWVAVKITGSNFNIYNQMYYTHLKYLFDALMQLMHIAPFISS